MVSAPLRLSPEFSSDDAGAFVCVSVIFGGVAFVELAFVGVDNDSGGGGFDSTLTGGGLDTTDRVVMAGSRWVTTLVPTITSGGAVTTGAGGGGGGRLVLTGVTG